MNIDKRSCLARANQLLSDPTPENLLYAALQLRLCMESLTYEKLRTYSNIVPASILEKWQPPQAVRALLAFEPNADQSFTLRIGRQDKLGEPAKEMKVIGEHKSLRLNWLRKHYHKLGYYLHAPSTATGSSTLPVNLAAYLQEVATELTEPVNSRILGATFRETFTFKCVKCNDHVVVNKKALSSQEKVTCFNPNCGAEYSADVSDIDHPIFDLFATKFECQNPNCTTEIAVEDRFLDVGCNFKCPTCDLRHEIVDHYWEYQTKK